MSTSATKGYRLISPAELEVLRAWLDHDVAGAALLLGQLTEETQVYRSCDCGCSSLGFVHTHEATEQGASIFEIDAEVMNERGESIGGMMLTVREGRLRTTQLSTLSHPLKRFVIAGMIQITTIGTRIAVAVPVRTGNGADPTNGDSAISNRVSRGKITAHTRSASLALFGGEFTTCKTPRTLRPFHFTFGTGCAAICSSPDAAP